MFYPPSGQLSWPSGEAFGGFGADEGGQTDWADKTDIPLMGGAEVLGAIRIVIGKMLLGDILNTDIVSMYWSLLRCLRRREIIAQYHLPHPRKYCTVLVMSK